MMSFWCLSSLLTLNKYHKFFLVFITAQNMKSSIKDFFSKCDQIRSFLRIWSHLLRKFLMENFFFAVHTVEFEQVNICRVGLDWHFILLVA